MVSLFRVLQHHSIILFVKKMFFALLQNICFLYIVCFLSRFLLTYSTAYKFKTRQLVWMHNIKRQLFCCSERFISYNQWVLHNYWSIIRTIIKYRLDNKNGDKEVQERMIVCEGEMNPSYYPKLYSCTEQST